MKYLLFFLLYLLTYSLSAEQHKMRINVIEYHDQPPFIINAKAQQGFSFDIINLLNENSTLYHYQLSIVPKKRAQRTVRDWINGNCFSSTNCDENWIMLWTHPNWGWGDNAVERYLWHPLFIDDDAIVSHVDSQLIFTGVQSLIGYRLGGLSGHHYQGIDELITQGKIKREDTHDEETLILRVLKKRVDSIVMQRSALTYYLSGRYHSEEKQLLVSELPYQQFTASAMLPPKRNDLKEALIQLTQSEQWQKLLDKYELIGAN